MIYLFILLVVWIYLSMTSKPSNMLNGHTKFFTKYKGFLVTFLILAFFSAIRDDCGCDYNSYIMHILNIQKGLPNYMEPGFQISIFGLGLINDNPRLVIIVFGVLTCFFYLLAIWNQSTNRALSVFIFLSWGYYFMTFNTLRNYFALSIVLCTFPLLLKKKNLKFILIVLFAALFHKSALFCLPVYYIANKVTFTKQHIFPIILVTLLLLSLQSFFRSYVFILYPTYEGSDYDTGRISYLNILKALLAIFAYIRYKKYVEGDSLCKLYFNLNVFAFMVYTGIYWLPEVSRIGFYLNASVIMFIPRLINYLPRKERSSFKKIFYLGSLVLFAMLLIQFTSETTRLLPYKTWLFEGTYDHY